LITHLVLEEERTLDLKSLRGMHLLEGRSDTLGQVELGGRRDKNEN
jgi:hypothetical protein